MTDDIEPPIRRRPLLLVLCLAGAAIPPILALALVAHAQTAAPQVKTVAGVGSVYTRSAPCLAYEASIPELPDAKLAAALVAADQQDFDQVAAKAASGACAAPGYKARVDYRLTATTPRLISLDRSKSTKIAAPGDLIDDKAVIWDRQAGAAIPFAALFRPDADEAPLNAALCAAAQKAAFDHAGLKIEAKDCPTWRASTAATLAKSKIAGKIGGVRFSYFRLDAAGVQTAYGYQALIPLSVFKDALKPDYATDFAGEPRDEDIGAIDDGAWPE